MKQFEQEKVSERFSKLPEEVQDVIVSEEMNTYIKDAMTSVGLEGEKKKECIQQITLVSVGFSTAGDFHEYVQRELGLDEQNSSTFEKTVTETIFTPIKKHLLKALQATSQEGGAGVSQDGTMNTVPPKNDPYRET